MTEKEIIQCLKDNKKKGICYEFFDDDIQDWCCKNFKKLLILDKNGEWENVSTMIESILFYANDIIALPEDFKREIGEGEWVDFDIELDGCFKANNSYYYWTKWGDFINEYNGKDNYTAFGGWQYENDNRWYMAPVVKNENDIEYWNSYTVDKEFIKPCIPIKIRFWRK